VTLGAKANDTVHPSQMRHHCSQCPKVVQPVLLRSLKPAERVSNMPMNFMSIVVKQRLRLVPISKFRVIIFRIGVHIGTSYSRIAFLAANEYDVPSGVVPMISLKKMGLIGCKSR
jgi:hypothetical protein